jgi:hypothetical protein
MIIELFIKEKSLAAEAKIIKKAEAKLRSSIQRQKIMIATGRVRQVRGSDKQIPVMRAEGDYYPETATMSRFQRESLFVHRTRIVRKAARSTHLAHGFLRGTPYLAMERTCHHKPDWKAVEAMVKRYGEGDVRDLMQKFSEWITET